MFAFGERGGLSMPSVGSADHIDYISHTFNAPLGEILSFNYPPYPKL